MIQDSTAVAAGETSETEDVVERVSPSASMKSDRFLSPLSIEDYLDLLDWTVRQVVPGKRGSTPNTLPPVLARLGLDAACWCELVSDFGRLFCSVAGRPECVDSMRCHRTQLRYHLRRRARVSLAVSLYTTFAEWLIREIAATAARQPHRAHANALPIKGLRAPSA